jgi:hypothetical protein
MQAQADKPTGMMFDAMPAELGGGGDGGRSVPEATAAAPLVGSFAAPAGAIDEGVSLVAGRVSGGKSSVGAGKDCTYACSLCLE